MELDDFRKLLNRNKTFRDLSDEYKSDKFLKLYLKMYEYALSVPKEEIVYDNIKKELLDYINYFLKAKDFYNWRYRVYKLLTKKLHNPCRAKYELLYNSKAKKYWDEYIQKNKESCERYYLENFGVHNAMQVKEIKEKSKKNHIESVFKTYGVVNIFQLEETKEKSKETFRKKHGVENPSQVKEFKEKGIETKIKRYGTANPCNNIKSHSKIADEFCTNLYTNLPDDVKPYCTFYKKDNKEYSLRDKDRIFYYDFTFIRENDKIIIEFDGIYWHGLKEGQRYVRDIPVEEVWEEDRKKQKLAEDNGFRVIRVREDEYLEDKEGCIERIVDDFSRFFRICVCGYSSSCEL